MQGTVTVKNFIKWYSLVGQRLKPSHLNTIRDEAHPPNTFRQTAQHSDLRHVHIYDLIGQWAHLPTWLKPGTGSGTHMGFTQGAPTLLYFSGMWPPNLNIGLGYCR